MSASEATESKRSAILEVTKEVFLRYGYKKTSMEDVARAAGLSRQGLYLHFPTKEALFRAGVQHLAESTRMAAQTALVRSDLDLQARLLATFEAVHGHAIGQSWGEHMDELLEASTELVGPVLSDLEQAIVTDVAETISSASHDAAKGVVARELAELLYSVSIGIKHRVSTKEAYRERMGEAVRVVFQGRSFAA